MEGGSQGLGGREMGSYYLVGAGFQFSKIKTSSRDGWSWWLHSSMEVLSVTELYAVERVKKMVNYARYIL